MRQAPVVRRLQDGGKEERVMNSKFTDEFLEDFQKKVESGKGIPVSFGHDENASDVENICRKLDVITALLIWILKGISTDEEIHSTSINVVSKD